MLQSIVVLCKRLPNPSCPSWESLHAAHWLRQLSNPIRQLLRQNQEYALDSSINRYTTLLRPPIAFSLPGLSNTSCKPSFMNQHFQLPSLGFRASHWTGRVGFTQGLRARAWCDAMDAANGVPGRPLNWLPSAFIRADSVVLHLKAFSVTHAVKSLLSLKNKPQQQQPFNKDSWVFQPSAKPLVPSDCQCESLCECGEDDYEDEELQCQLLPVCASDVCFRRQSRSPIQNWASVQNFSWARSLARREPAESATIKGNSQESEKTTSMWTASVSPKRKHDADKNEIKENSVKVRSSESAESETQKSHATPTSTSTAHEVYNRTLSCSSFRVQAVHWSIRKRSYSKVSSDLRPPILKSVSSILNQRGGVPEGGCSS